MEIFKDIIGYEGFYQISNLGNVKSLIAGKQKILKHNISSNKYYSIRFKNKNFLIHRLVALHFVNNFNNKPYVNHIDGNKFNNNFKNLEFVTQSENINHAIKIGKFNNNGINHPKSKLNKIQVNIIFKRANLGEDQRKIAKDFNISQSVISNIKQNKTYKL
jgi:hypothetical protein